MKTKETKEVIGVIGLGYVGLPLACLFASRYRVVGFDLNEKRIQTINSATDAICEVDALRLSRALADGLRCTSDPEELRSCNFYVVAVPTPIGENNMPLLTPLESASRTVGRALKPGDIVVYESTVWPGMTEEYCVPILEQTSGLVLNEGFTVGYSPERINPGDKCHTVETITKITSGSTPEAAEWVDRVYASVLQAGTYRAPSIKVAEAAKVLENTQRDVNIAVMNQASVIFDAMGIDSYAVLEAAGTKWNFLPFRPGLVGGHCIGVDPYYLIERAKEFGVDPKLFIEARRTNEAMAPYVAQRVIQQIGLSGFNVQNAKILLLGITFKENCSDIRNTKVVDVYNALNAQAESVVVFDPWADPDLMHEEYGIQVLTDPEELKASKFDAIVHAVNHDCFKATDWSCYLTPNGIYYDLKAYNPPPKSEPECTPQKAFAVQCEPKQMVQDATRFVAAKNPEQKHHHRTMLG